MSTGSPCLSQIWGKQTTVIQLRWHFKSSCAQNISSHQPFLDVINDKRTFFHNIGYITSRCMIYLVNSTNLMGHDLFVK